MKEKRFGLLRGQRLRGEDFYRLLGGARNRWTRGWGFASRRWALLLIHEGGVAPEPPSADLRPDLAALAKHQMETWRPCDD